MRAYRASPALGDRWGSAPGLVVAFVRGQGVLGHGEEIGGSACARGQRRKPAGHVLITFVCLRCLL